MLAYSMIDMIIYIYRYRVREKQRNAEGKKVCGKSVELWRGRDKMERRKGMTEECLKNVGSGKKVLG